MFDITSFIREKIFKRPKLNQEHAWEELSEKQTTKLGYFLLYCMFWAILTSAQWTLNIIKHIPDVPTNAPYCVNTIIKTLDNTENDYNHYSRYPYDNCQITSINPKFNFNPEYSKLKTPYNEIIEINKNIDKLNYKKESIKRKKVVNQENYKTSLTEKIAWENSWLYNKNNIQQNIKNNRSEIINIDSKVDFLKSKIENIKLKYINDISRLKQKFDKANKEYRNSYLLYKFYVAVLSFLFSIIVFCVLYKVYVREKINNSPHTIIFSVATFAYWLVLLQIAILFIWDIIPHKLLEIIANLFNIFTPLIYIVQFLWPILIITIFWFLVYKIQKRLYSPKNILKRFVADKKCPNCWNWVDFTKPFCPLCSHEIQIHCSNCHKLTLKWMPYCSECWWKQIDQNIIS